MLAISMLCAPLAVLAFALLVSVCVVAWRGDRQDTPTAPWLDRDVAVWCASGETAPDDAAPAQAQLVDPYQGALNMVSVWIRGTRGTLREIWVCVPQGERMCLPGCM